MSGNSYPQNPTEWMLAIHEGTGLNGQDGMKAYRLGKFPYEKLEQWIDESFSEGFSQDFVPALQRNIKGLVAWVYGDGDEPFWPGTDNETIS